MSTLSARQGKYLTFSLGSEEYGLEILKVREIIGYMTTTVVPRTADHVKGVINLRGQVIPVIDLRLAFMMPEAEITDQTCIIVVEIDNRDETIQTGIVVDNVSEVLDIQDKDLEPPPHSNFNVAESALLAMAKIGDSVKLLLDIDKVICPPEHDFSDSLAS